jgi:hypothetical protein
MLGIRSVSNGMALEKAKLWREPSAKLSKMPTPHHRMQARDNRGRLGGTSVPWRKGCAAR